MHRLPVAVSHRARAYLQELPGWELVPLLGDRDAAAFVMCAGEKKQWEGRLGGAPLILCEDHLLDLAETVNEAASAYERRLLPPFTARLAFHADTDPLYFATPGHHGGRFYRQTAGGRLFCSFLGEGMFRMDLSDSDSAVGDVTAHEGPGGEAEALAAEVYQADRTYFVLNGTSAANRICCAALLAPGDLVLFDRNNHKSLYQGAFELTGAVPVYLEGLRNEAGVIGGVSADSFRPHHLRELARQVSPEKAEKKRPFRLACFQLCTYDGIFLNARRVICGVGPLCDYILFDSAWAGYESFIPFMEKECPLTAPLSKKSPGILVTQSVHKQLAGFTQTSQIHRKDAHLPEKRRLADAVFQSAFLRHVSTSPSLPLFAGLEMNAAIHREKGPELWASAVRFSVDLRRRILETCHLIRPFQPDTVDGRPWMDYDTETIASERRFWDIRPEESWHGFHGLGKNQCILDPCKVLLLTGPIPGPAAAQYLEERGIVPEKAGLQTVLLLAEPGDGPEKAERLCEALRSMEAAWQNGELLREVFPALTAAGLVDPDGSFRALCQAQRQFLIDRRAPMLEQRLFDRAAFPETAMTGRDAAEAFVRGEGELVRLREAEGRIALEAAAMYPPGISMPAAGEVWNRPVLDWCACLIDFGAAFPAFAPDIHGVHQKESEGKRDACVWVLREKGGKKRGKKR